MWASPFHSRCIYVSELRLLLSAMFVEKKRQKERRSSEREREKEGWIVGRSMKRERVKITNGWIKATRKVVW